MGGLKRGGATCGGRGGVRGGRGGGMMMLRKAACADSSASMMKGLGSSSSLRSMAKAMSMPMGAPPQSNMMRNLAMPMGAPPQNMSRGMAVQSPAMSLSSSNKSLTVNKAADQELGLKKKCKKSKKAEPVV